MKRTESGNTVRWNQERIEHARIPEWVLDAEISDRAIRLYAVLGRYADNVKGTAFPKQATLADRLRCSVDSLERAMKELEEIGALGRERRGPHSNLYTLIWRPEHRIGAVAPQIDSAPVREQDPAAMRILDSAPVRDRTIGQLNSGSENLELHAPTVRATTAQTLVATYVDQAREQGYNPPRRVIGQIARLVGELLDEGQPPEVVANALVLMSERRLHPSTLPTLIAEAALGPPRRRKAISTLDADYERMKAQLRDGA